MRDRRFFLVESSPDGFSPLVGISSNTHFCRAKVKRHFYPSGIEPAVLAEPGALLDPDFLAPRFLRTVSRTAIASRKSLGISKSFRERQHRASFPRSSLLDRSASSALRNFIVNFRSFADRTAPN